MGFIKDKVLPAFGNTAQNLVDTESANIGDKLADRANDILGKLKFPTVKTDAEVGVESKSIVFLALAALAAFIGIKLVSSEIGNSYQGPPPYSPPRRRRRRR